MRRLLTVVVMVVTSAWVTPGAASASVSVSDANTTALSSLAACLRDTNRLSLEMLIDESGSLQDTDPTHQRVVAARSLLWGLQALTNTTVGGEHPKVDIAVSGFSVNYEPVVPWTPLTTASVATLDQAIESFGDRNTGVDTDFGSALHGSRKNLAAHAARMSGGGGPPCQALILFTDGNYDIELRSTQSMKDEYGNSKFYAPGVPLDTESGRKTAITKGRAYVCNPGGVADQIRGDGITLVTVALTGGISPEDEAFLQALAAGQSGPTKCGHPQNGNGAYLPTENISELLGTFDSVANQIGGGTILPGQTPGQPCVGVPCVRAERRFVVAPSFTRLHLLATTGTPGIRIQLVGPHGKHALDFVYPRSGAAAISGAQASFAWLSPEALNLDLRFPTSTRSQWTGIWSVRFIDPDGSHPDTTADAQIYVYGGLQPKLESPSSFTLGEPSTVVASVVDEEGMPTSAEGLFTSATMGGAVADPSSGATTPLDFEGPDGSGRFTATYSPPATLKSSVVNLSLELTAVTKQGLALTPTVQTYSIPLRPPVTYPQVKPAELRLSSILGEGAAEGEIVVAGGSTPGCVWFGTADFSSVPDGVNEITLATDPSAEDQGGCLRLKAGQERVIRVSAQPSGSGIGRVSGSLPIQLSSDASTDVISLRMPVSFAMDRPVSEGKRLALFLALLLIGILVPIGLLYLLNSRDARFQKSDMLRVATVNVALTPNVVTQVELDGGGPVRPAVEEFRNFPGSASRVRTLAYGPLGFRARISGSPVSPPFGEVTAGGLPLVTSESPESVATAGRLPLELRGSWIFVASSVERQREHRVENESAEPDESVVGILYLFASHPVDQQPERMLLQVERDLPPLESQLAAAINAQRPQATAPSDEQGAWTPSPMPDLYGDGPGAISTDVPSYTDETSPRSAAPPTSIPAERVPEPTEDDLPKY